jgi:hypothetical protein
MSVSVGTARYTFARWEGSGGYLVSTSNSFTYAIYSSRDFYAVYAQAQTTTTTARTTRTTQGYLTTTPPSGNLYTVTIIVSHTKLGLSKAGWSVYLDSKYVGQTDSYGRLTITNVKGGGHKFSFKRSNSLYWYYFYYDVKSNIQLTVSLT